MTTSLSEEAGMLTNRLNLPRSIFAAVANDPYTKGKSDISVTGLIAPPYQRKLRESTEVQEDVSDRIWSLLGQSVHTVLERAYPEGTTDAIVEQRLFAEVNGWTVSGQMDVLEGGVLNDFKVTSVWSRDGKIEWEQQLNLLAALCRREFQRTGDDRYLVTKLQIIAIYRDWVMSKTFDQDYPQAQVGVIEVPLWDLDRQEAFLLERVVAHQSPEPPVCTDDERWKTETVWALMKEGRKSAVKLYGDEASANEACEKAGKGHSVVCRLGEYRRCANYCNVSHACPAWNDSLTF